MSADLGFRVSFLRVRFSFVTVSFGLFVFLVGAKPNWFGWDRSPVVGFVQIAVFMIGLALICIGGYVGLVAMWGNEQRSITADIGLRLVGTGFVIAIFTGMADIVGLGSQPLPNVPYFGPWQAGGVVISQLIIALGFLMSIPYHLLIKGKEK
jgi:hypothetical protein